MNNCLTLEALLKERGPVRYTPGGVPILDATLEHQSSQAQGPQSIEPGQPRLVERKVGFELAAQFPGALARQADVLTVGTPVRVVGFLATRRAGARTLVLQVRSFEVFAVPDEDPV